MKLFQRHSTEFQHFTYVTLKENNILGNKSTRMSKWNVSSLITPLLRSDGIGFATVAASSVAMIVYMQRRSRRNPFPNATPFPFNQTVLGELLYLYVIISKFHNGEVPSYYRSLRKKLGCVLYFGPIASLPHKCPCISLSDPKDQANFMKQEKELELTVNMPDTAAAIHGEGNFQSIHGQAHASLRKIFSSILSPRSLEAFTTIIVKEFQILWNDLETKQDELEIQTAIRETQLKIMCKILYGFGTETDEDRRILTEFSKDFALTEKALFPIGGEKSKDFQEGMKAKKRINKILNDKFDSIFEKRIAQEGEHNHMKTNDSVIGSAMDQIVDGLIRSGCTSQENRGENGINNISYENARGNLYLLLEASHITTMTVTSSMMYFLNHSENKESLDRVRNEVRSLEPSYQSLKGLTFGAACVDETLRLAPIIGSISYFIPKSKSFKVRGEAIHGPIVVNFQNSNWYQDEDVFEMANNFKPERWLSGEKQVSTFAKSVFRPFGFGRHICLGTPLARLVMNANLYSFASNPNRSIVFNEEKVGVRGGLFPEKQVCHGFMGKVVVNERSEEVHLKTI